MQLFRLGGERLAHMFPTGTINSRKTGKQPGENTGEVIKLQLFTMSINIFSLNLEDVRLTFLTPSPINKNNVIKNATIQD